MTEARCKIEGLEKSLADQALQISVLSSQLADSQPIRASSTANDAEHVEAEMERRVRQLEMSHKELEQSEARVADELLQLQDQTSRVVGKASELTETRGKVDGLEVVVADQAAQIMTLSSRLAGDLAKLEASGCVIRDRMGQLAGRAKALGDELSEHELDLSGLKNVCAALYSEKASLELDALPHAADDSSLALLADLVRRFPLAAGTSGAGSEGILRQRARGSEDSASLAPKLKLSEGSWWEPVD